MISLLSFNCNLTKPSLKEGSNIKSLIINHHSNICYTAIILNHKNISI